MANRGGVARRKGRSFDGGGRVIGGELLVLKWGEGATEKGKKKIKRSD